MLHNNALSKLQTVASYARRWFAGSIIKRVTVVMPLDIHKRLKFIGINDDTTMNALILNAVKQYLSEYGSKSSNVETD